MTISRPQDRLKADSVRRPRFDPWLVVMAVGFALAIAAIAYPAFRASAFTAPGLILIFAAGATALIWLSAFGRSERRPAAGDAAVEMLDAMAEPAALVQPSGQVLAYNAAWAEE
ncbi:MAG: hybrid sensor histidine kinase/response regulator, partial [Bordetella sp.]|nr:hybrid sensor histidine kinase/response regulator [Bordetella sp.]